MYAGGALAVLGLIAGVATLHELKTMIEQQNPGASQAAVSASLGTAVVVLVVLGIAGATLWLWLARETKSGRQRARGWSTAIFCIASLGGANLAHARATGPSGAFGFVEWLVGLAAIILLWSRPSRRYYAARREASGYAAPPPSTYRSPSLRARQAPYGSPGGQGGWLPRPPADWAGQIKAAQTKAAQGKAAQGKAAQGKAAQGKAAQGKAAQGGQPAGQRPGQATRPRQRR